MEIREAQRLAWENKLNKGFNTSNVELEFGLMTAEVGEAFTAWRKRKSDFGEELADVLLYLTAIASMNGSDLDDEVAKKIRKNQHRTYERDQNGTLLRVSGD
ncbi:MazG nucleotide pyrophosphohydrolase domain-containing protein [Streptomyces sp. XH2]|uniref:MazG nucleotide pyrophosphohydrolase domain-containing protein n=1 Tax=Streptomyces sp. XH2 TaxID=3412483 RepID=UPI003C7CCB59